ncbi:uncharacterized protein LOC111053522 [Nilaparvata lugens]|uniref:uncharacterized protein LOC111053522 n=1 Tax=Nilaparvata lugens TaxID=108931 RepID=UPI00193EC042|nr:uncharacterized protein LOC111053522 [Nilaparvata lugens]
MLKWAVGQRENSNGGCCRATLKLPRRHHNRENKENNSQASATSSQNNTGGGGEAGSRDSIYMRLEAIPAVLRDVSNQAQTGTPEQAGRRRSGTMRFAKSPCKTSTLHHVTALPGLKRRLEDHPQRFDDADQNDAHSLAPVTKKQPCMGAHDPVEGAALLSAPSQSCSALYSKDHLMTEIEYSPCPLRATQSLMFLRKNICLDNPLYYTLPGSPTPSPEEMINKELPAATSETPMNPVVSNLKFLNAKRIGFGSSPSKSTSDVSPLARRLAYLRLSNTKKLSGIKVNNDDGGLVTPSFLQSGPENLRHCEQENSILEHLKKSDKLVLENNENEVFRFGQIHRDATWDKNPVDVQGSSKENLQSLRDNFRNQTSTNHDRHNVLQNISNFNLGNSKDRSPGFVNSKRLPQTNNLIEKEGSEQTKKRRGIVFDEQNFSLNTPGDSESVDRQSSSFTASVDLDKPSTFKRQRVIVRRRNSSKNSNRKRIPHIISSLTLSKGLPSPFFNDSFDDEQSNEKGTSKDSSKETRGSFMGLTLPEGIPSPSSSEGNEEQREDFIEDLPGVKPLKECGKGHNRSKRKAENSCDTSVTSEGTWNSHRMHFLKTPRLTDAHILHDATFSMQTSSSQNLNEEDEGVSSLASSDVGQSPLAMVERRSRSRRCLRFASPRHNTSLHKPRSTSSRKKLQEKGELELSVYCNNNMMTIHIVRARNLYRSPRNEPCNAYVKVCLIPSASERTFHRTCVRKDSNNPRFDHKFSLELNDEDMERRLLVSAWHRDRTKRRSEFLGCMTFAVKNAVKKEISGTFRLLSQNSGRTQHVPSGTGSGNQGNEDTAVMANQSDSSIEELVSIEESDVPPTPEQGSERRKSSCKKTVEKGYDDNIFLKHLELDPPPPETTPAGGGSGGGGGIGKGGSTATIVGSKGGRTPFTTTRKLCRKPGTSFGFSIAWTHPPRIERVESGLPADQAGLRPGDYVIFVDKTNVVTLQEEEILKLIKSCGNQLILEVYRKTNTNGVVGRNSLAAMGLHSSHTHAHAPARSSTACSGATTATATASATASASLELTKRRLHLPQVTFTSEGVPENINEARRRAIYQLLNLEQQFALCLQFGISRFLLPLAERRDVISPQDHNTLFQNAQEMPAINSCYRRYCVGLKKADCLLVEKTRDANFMRLLTEPPIPRRRPDLTTFLHKPLEHYRDVLKALQTIHNNTSAKDHDYPAINKVVQDFQSTYRDVTVESGLMEPEGDGKPLLSLQDLESRLVFTRCKPFVLSSPGRQWIFGGDLSRVEGRSVRPFWALLFTDLLLFAKVSRDRVLFVTEEPLSLLTVSQALFSIRKKATEFRLLLSSTPPGTDSPVPAGCGGALSEFPLRGTPRKNSRKRTVALRAPTPELKAVWQNLIQRQIIYLNTGRGGTPASSPLDSPDPLTADSVATLDSMSLKRQVVIVPPPSPNPQPNNQTQPQNESKNETEDPNDNPPHPKTEPEKDSDKPSPEKEPEKPPPEKEPKKEPDKTPPKDPDSTVLAPPPPETRLPCGLDELIEHRCRQLGKSGSKGSALHLAQWMRGQLGTTAGGPSDCSTSNAPTSPDEPEMEVWSTEELRRREEMIHSSPRNVSRCEDFEMSDQELRSQSRCSTSDSQMTVRSTSANSERPLTVCRQCHKTCLVSNNNNNTSSHQTPHRSERSEHHRRQKHEVQRECSTDTQSETDVNANPTSNRTSDSTSDFIDDLWGPISFVPSVTNLNPVDPFSPVPVPHISVLPPSPPSNRDIRSNNNFWEDAPLTDAKDTTTAASNIIVNNKSPSKPINRQNSRDDEAEDSEGDAEEPPYRSLSPCALKRYGTVSSLEKLDESDGDETGKEQEELPSDVQSGYVTQSIRGWTVKAGTFVAEKMSFFERLGEDTKGASFFDRYLRAMPEHMSEELAATSTTVAGEDECETSGGTSGEEVWGTPTSGDSELASPIEIQSPDSAIGTAQDDAREQLMMEELLGSVVSSIMAPGSCLPRAFPQRRRLEPLPEDEENSSESTSPDVSECTRSHSTDQGNRSDSCVIRMRTTSNTKNGFFNKLRLRRSHSADSRHSKSNRILKFLRTTKSEEHTSCSSSSNRLMRLFSRDSIDDIPTTMPINAQPTQNNSANSSTASASAANSSNQNQRQPHDKSMERRFWKQLRRRRNSGSKSSISAN